MTCVSARCRRKGEKKGMGKPQGKVFDRGLVLNQSSRGAATDISFRIALAKSPSTGGLANKKCGKVENCKSLAMWAF